MSLIDSIIGLVVALTMLCLIRLIVLTIGGIICKMNAQIEKIRNS